MVNMVLFIIKAKWLRSYFPSSCVSSRYKIWYTICSSLDYFPCVAKRGCPHYGEVLFSLLLRQSFVFVPLFEGHKASYLCTTKQFIEPWIPITTLFNGNRKNRNQEMGKMENMCFKYLTCYDTCLLPKNPEIKNMTDISHISLLHS